MSFHVFSCLFMLWSVLVHHQHASVPTRIQQRSLTTRRTLVPLHTYNCPLAQPVIKASPNVPARRTRRTSTHCKTSTVGNIEKQWVLNGFRATSRTPQRINNKNRREPCTVFLIGQQQQGGRTNKNRTMTNTPIYRLGTYRPNTAVAPWPCGQTCLWSCSRLCRPVPKSTLDPFHPWTNRNPNCPGNGRWNGTPVPALPWKEKERWERVNTIKGGVRSTKIIKSIQSNQSKSIQINPNQSKSIQSTQSIQST